MYQDRLCGAQKGKTFQERCLVGKLPNCCKTTSYRFWQFTVALITPCSFLWKGISKLLAIETSCRWPTLSLLWLTWAFLRQLMRFVRNYHVSVNAKHPLPTPLPSPLSWKSGLNKEKSRPSNAENVELFQWGLAILFQSVKRLVCSRAQIITQHLVPHT